MRIGIGYDVHRFDTSKDLILGGVKIPYDQGLLGHSDADVLLHAIMDALLGAAGLGDIGKLFPDTDLKYKNISSMVLLETVFESLKSLDYKVINIDSVIVCQAPKLSPYMWQMCENISSVLKIQSSQVNVKATTTEKLGFEGRKEGISAQAVALLSKF
jgi:2-C-methyl-D-erythritol 2,4-cyclodiphosphate synthase